MTVLIGGLVFLFLPDSPVKAKRFSDAEKIAALLRVKENQSGTQNAVFKKEQLLESIKDVRVWLVALSVMLTSIPNGGLSNFSSILLTTFGYSSQQALILNLPAGAVGVVFVLGSGWLSDRFHDRSTIMLVCLIPTIIAAAMVRGVTPIIPDFITNKTCRCMAWTPLAFRRTRPLCYSLAISPARSARPSWSC